MFFMLVGSLILFVVSPFFVRRRKNIYATVILSRYLVVCALSQMLRCITFLVTILPGPNYHCRPDSTEYNPPKTVFEILMRKNPFLGCGDLVFSSHTIFVLLSALTYTKYGDSPLLKKVVWVMAFMFGALVVAARKHYTLDIVVAWYTVPLVWLVYDNQFPDRLPQELIEFEKRNDAMFEDDIKKVIV